MDKLEKLAKLLKISPEKLLLLFDVLEKDYGICLQEQIVVDKKAVELELVNRAPLDLKQMAFLYKGDKKKEWFVPKKIGKPTGKKSFIKK